MIAYLSGSVVLREAQSVIVQTGGIGYRVYVPDEQELSHDHVDLWIYTHWSQDQGPTLYGFTHKEQMHAFSLMLYAQGVGPRLALECLATLSAASLVGALAQDDVTTLRRIPGIGQQKATKIAFHLKDKAHEMSEYVDMSQSAHAHIIHDVRAAMISLGYTQHEIDRALKRITIDADDRFDTVLRKALSQLAQ